MDWLMTGGSLHLERLPHPNFDVASGHERPGTTSNQTPVALNKNPEGGQTAKLGVRL